MKILKQLSLTALLLAAISSTAQTDLKKPELSQAASVSQQIGLTTINVTYHSPLTKGRKIWGDIVPYGEVWRAGANENTTISFSSDVEVEGKALAAGTYGLHMIPTEKDWTIIFSKNNYAWGSFFYQEKDDALRVQVSPESATDQDWLSYAFAHPKDQSVTLQLHWEKLIVPIRIDVDVPEVVYQSMKKELSNINGFFWQGHNQAAAYCIQKNIHLDDAEKWINKSIGIQKTFANLTTKSKLMEKNGKTQEADALRKEALALADEAQLNTYGYELINQKRNEEALEIFKLNVKRYPNSWNVYDSLGEMQDLMGDRKSAIGNYKTALSKAPDTQKKRIQDILKKLEAKS